ncbi:MAG: Ig-like domain-containing protein [Paludibacteraceae bacterium]|nr:Ig-like domain-containing protein [Paludibacteraceae bacterium]
MKKYLIVLAAALVALASCTQKETNKYTSLKFKNAELTMAVGATEKLQVLYEPTTLDAPACVWASSNEEAVTVDQKGNVTAVAAGEANVTATYGEGESQLKAVCKVTVQDARDMLVWAGWSLWNLDKSNILSNDTVKKTLQSGKEVSCVMIPATYKIWSQGVYLDVDHLAGAGYIASVEGTALLITDDLGQGPNYYYLGVSRLDIVPAANFNWNDTAFANCAVAGALLGTAAEHYAWLTDTTDLVPQAFTGAIQGIDFNNQKYLDPFAGLIGSSIFVGDETTALYKSYASWFEEPQYWGFKLELVTDEETGEEEYDFVQPYEWAPLGEAKYYEYLGEAETAPKTYTVEKFVEKKEQKIARPDVLTHK